MAPSDSPSSKSAATASVVIRCYNQWALTQRCIESLQTVRGRGLGRIILVDNGSEDETPQRALDYDLIYCRMPYNGGVAGTNRGLALALHEDSDVVVVLDNDAFLPPEPDLFERWLGWFEDPEVGAAGAVSGYTLGLQHATHIPRHYCDRKGRPVVRGDEKAPKFLISFAVAIRKRAMAEVGLWDERFGLGNSEDTDFCLRLREAGYRLEVARNVYVHHGVEAEDKPGLMQGSNTFTKVADHQQLVLRNHQLLTEKWGAEKLRAMGV